MNNDFGTPTEPGNNIATNFDIPYEVISEYGKFIITFKKVVEVDTNGEWDAKPADGYKVISIHCVVENINYSDPYANYDGVSAKFDEDYVIVLDNDGFILRETYASISATSDGEYAHLFNDDIPVGKKIKAALSYEAPIGCDEITVEINNQYVLEFCIE